MSPVLFRESFIGQQSVDQAYNHLLLLLTDDTALDDLHILQARKDLVLNLEANFHTELSSLLDCKWLLLKSLDGAGGFQVDDDVGPAGHLEAK
jgi:hypothetical protein